MAFLDFIFGKPSRRVEQDLYTPSQNQLLDQITAQIESIVPLGLQNNQNLLSNDPNFLKTYTQPAITELYQRILPETAERFTGNYGTGAFRSSAFGQEIGRAITNLEENLASSRYEQQQRVPQNIQSLLELLKIPLTPRTGFYNTPRQSGLLENLLMGILSNYNTLSNYNKKKT